MHRIHANLMMLPLLLWVSEPAALAQEGPANPPKEPGSVRASGIRLFLDAQQVFVDVNFLRTEITWVDWVRDAKDANVHLILTSRPTGSGGTSFSLRFIGLQGYQGLDDAFVSATPGVTTADEVRRSLASQIALGLARYLVREPGSQHYGVVAHRAEAMPPQPTVDPWDSWVYRMGVSGFANGESQYSSMSTSANLGASRITKEDIFRVGLSGNWNRNRYVLSDGTLDTRMESYNASGLLAQGLTDHWTSGLMLDADRSTMTNLKGSIRLAGGAEYNVWKYSEASQRQWTFRYELGVKRVRYLEETLFGKTSETLLDHALITTLTLNQPWGSVNVSMRGSTYLNDWSKSSLGLFNSLSLKLGQGFSMNLSGSYARVRDQLSLPKQGATQDEVLLRLRQLQTNYSYFVSLGLNYTFGSIFNNAVNTRFGGAGGGGTTIIISQ
ncbi:MAG: hypothetical protein WAS25_12090 [Geothrix sp.]|uniref:hypothetical protein n=1 Tax=Geothrix sp. TaxID=1962974 RepID=UPI003BAFF4C3